jgi:hypothetical protein
VTQNLVRDGVSYTDPRKRRFQNVILGCVLLRKNFWNGVLAYSFTKILLAVDKESASVIRKNGIFIN